MKKQISFICILAILLSTIMLPLLTFADNGSSDNSVPCDVEVELIPSDLFNYTECSDDDGVYYEMSTGNDHALVFDYQIESGYDYYLTYDYKGPATNNWGGWLQGIGAVAYPNTTAAGNTGYNGNAIQFSEPNSTSEWSTVNLEILSGDRLLSISRKNGTYLAITSSYVDAHAFRNIKITKKKVGSAIIPTALGSMKFGYENGDVYWQSTTTDMYSFTGFKTNYELKTNQKYMVTFDVKNPTGAFKYAGFYASPDSSKCDVWSDFTQSKFPYAAFTDFGSSEWTTKNYILDTASIDNLVTATNKYLSFGANISWSNGTTLAFKNLTITEIDNNTILPTAVDTMKIDVENGEIYWESTATEQYSFTGFNTGYELKPDTKYFITMDVRRPMGDCKYAGFYAAPSSTKCTVWSDLIESKLPYVAFTDFGGKEWTTKSLIIDTGSVENFVTGTNKYLSFGYNVYQSNGTTLAFKNLSVMEVNPEALILNGDFEEGLKYWEGAEGCAEISSDVYESGSNSLNVSGSDYCVVSHKTILESNSNYKLTFKYKGDFGLIPSWGISKGNPSMSETSLLYYGYLEDTNEWKEHSVVFSTENESLFSVMFQSGDCSNFYIDSVNIEKTDEDADEKNSARAPAYTNTEAANRFWHWDADTEEHNLVQNGNFDGEGGNWQSLLANGTFTVFETEEAKSGNKVLKFSALDLPEKTKNYLFVPCEPNTEYIISVWHKGEKRSATNNNDLRWGIANPLTGEFISERNLSCWDNEWHRTTHKFNSGNNTVIALAYIGGSSVAYIDDLQIFKYSDRENGRPTVMVQEQPTITDYEPENKTCDDSKNLFNNSGFEGSDISFWNGDDTLGYKGTVSEAGYLTVLDWDGTVEIGDTASSHKKALHYTANDKYTGHPLGTSYLNYIDVSPNTEYTFVADFRIDKEGDGRFGLVSVNDFYPRIIGEWITFDENLFNTDYKWQTVAFTFNSNEFDRVAFVVQDKGGAAFIDNLRLFKKTDGKYLAVNNPVIKSSEYTIKDGYLTLNKESLTVAQVMQSLKADSAISAFDINGKQINDKNGTLAGTGVTFKIMDGISVCDSVTVIIPGDVNGDAKVNSSDIDELNKFLVDKSELTEAAAKAGDMNSDGVLDINDSVLIARKSGKNISNVTSVLEGPQAISANTEFEAVYYVDGSDVSGVSGVIKYDSDNLKLVSVSPEIGAGWMLQYSESDGLIKFVFVDSSANNAISKKTALLTLTFKNGANANVLPDISVTEQKATAGSNILNIADATYTSFSQSGGGSLSNGSGNNSLNGNSGLSDNNRLASLIVKNADITPEFDPETKSYDASVSFDVRELIVEAVAEDENATVTVSDTELIYVGKNITKVTVLSQSGLKRTYKIYTQRSAPEKTKNTGTEDSGLATVWIILIAAGALLLVSGAVVTTVLVIKKHRRDGK